MGDQFSVFIIFQKPFIRRNESCLLIRMSGQRVHDREKIIFYPVVLDVEAVTSKNARTADLTMEERTEYCITFCEMIKQAGYTPMIYGNLKTFMLMLDLEKLEEYDKWFAHYDEEFYYPYDFKIWQYTDAGSVAGINGEVDINISFFEPAQ